MPLENENLVHFIGPANAIWSTANAGEAIPGTVTPLNWTIFGNVGEMAIRYGFQQIGALSAKDVCVPANRNERCLGIFYGHTAIKVDFLCEVGSRIPGTSGEAVAMQIVGAALPGLARKRQIWRYPIVALRLPWQLLVIRRRVDKMVRDTSLDWWRAGVRRAPILSLEDAKAQLQDAFDHFLSTNLVHTVAVVAAIQPSFDALSKLIDKAGRPDLRGDLMSGYGSHAESAMVYDMWAISRGRKTIEDFLSEYGFHGPREGEISGTVWREDPAPLRRLIDGYRRLDDKEDPSLLETEKVRRRSVAEKELLTSLPRTKRPMARLVLRAASKFVPMRGVGKMVFLSALDVLRATARRLGKLLAEQGNLDTPDDVFYLTYDELIGKLPPNAKQMV